MLLLQTRVVGQFNQLLITIALGTALANCSPAAADWPQILGPLRNGVSSDSLPESWPEQSLKIEWEAEVGEGYAAAVIVGDKVIAFHRVDNEEVVDALDSASGERLWRTTLPASYRGGINPDTGPRATPVVAQEKVIVWGAAGQLSCLALDSGAKAWSINLFSEFRGDENYFGAGSSPIIVDQMVIVNVGGRPGAGIVGVDLESGGVKWKATNEGTSYAAPTTLSLGNETLVVVPTRLQLIGLEPQTGRERFRVPFGRTGPTVNAALPLVVDNQIFVTAAYEIGAKLLQVSSNARGDLTITSKWENTDSLSSQYFTPVLHNGFLYGTDGREDFNDTSFRCVEFSTGKVLWQEELAGAHVLLIGDDLVIVSIEGDLLIAKADPNDFSPRLRTRFPDSASRAIPAYSDGKLFVRTNAVAGRGKLRCINLIPE